MPTSQTIQQVAHATGLSAYTLRYYEQIGLIDPIPRAANGHRRYRDEDRRWIDFLLRLRSTGMPVQQMLHYATLRRAGNSLRSVAERKAMLEQHTLALELQLHELQENVALMHRKIDTYAALECSLSTCLTSSKVEASHESNCLPTWTESIKTS
jgi:DNA-binding transcriptional MerR regulator